MKMNFSFPCPVSAMDEQSCLFFYTTDVASFLQGPKCSLCLKILSELQILKISRGSPVLEEFSKIIKILKIFEVLEIFRIRRVPRVLKVLKIPLRNLEVLKEHQDF